MKMTMANYSGAAKIIAGVAGLSVFAFCIYYDRKRRSDPQFREKLKRRREEARKTAKSTSSDLSDLPDLKDQEAVQKFFMDEVSKGEELLAMGQHEECVKHLTNAIAVCGQPQQLLQVFRNSLPPNVFQMLIQNLALLGSAQMQQMQRASQSTGEVVITEDTEGLD